MNTHKHICVCRFWIVQNFHSGFSIRCYGKLKHFGQPHVATYMCAYIYNLQCVYL